MKAWLLLVLLFIAGCASTPMSEEFKRIKPGMEKDEVLTIMGTPRVYRRVKSLDYYTYVFYEHGTRIEREVQFDRGRVIYAGAVSQPAESAEEADERIRKENEKADAERTRRKKERKELPQTLEKELKGKPEEKVMPQYHEI